MSARSGMADLIARVRLHVGDSGTSQVFTDVQVQDALDATRVEQRLVACHPRPSLLPGGSVAYLDYFAPDSEWEGTASSQGSVPLLQDPSYTIVTPTTSDLINGIFHFDAQPAGGALLLATGATYDSHLAAARIARQWAAQLVLAFDFTTDQQTFNRSQQRVALFELAALLESKAKPSRIMREQADAAHRGHSGTPTYGGLWGPGVFP